MLVGRRALSMRGLALAAMALMLLAPQEVVGVSFQMSFAAVMALIAGYEVMSPVLARLRGHRVARHVAALVLTSLLAGVAAAPFGAYHFGRVQLYFILANLLAVPLTAMLVMPAGLLALMLMPFGLERLALVPMGWGLDAIIAIARTVAAIPAATFGVPHMPVWGLGLVAIGLAWLGLWRSRMRLVGAVVVAAGLLSGLASPPADLLVAPDARLIAWRSPPLLQTRPGFSRFVLDSWSQYWAQPLAAAFPKAGPPARSAARRMVAGSTRPGRRCCSPVACARWTAAAHRWWCLPSRREWSARPCRESIASPSGRMAPMRCGCGTGRRLCCPTARIAAIGPGWRCPARSARRFRWPRPMWGTNVCPTRTRGMK